MTLPLGAVVRADLTGSSGAVTPAGALQRWPSQQDYLVPLRISLVPTRRWMTSDRPGAADDPMLVFDLTDQVRETIQQTLYSLLMLRRSVFS